MHESFSVSAPGKLMLLGEHAVLSGSWSLVCAVNQRMIVRFTHRTDASVVLKSALGEFQTDLTSFIIDEKFKFILTCIKNYYSGKTGFELEITSDFSRHVGLGSSAAVTAATLGVLAHLESNFDLEQIFSRGLSVIQQVQGTGSGADLAASVFGGVLKYRTGPQSIEKVPTDFPLTVVYSGSKTPTTTVIQIVNEKKKQNPDLFEKIYDTISASAILAANAIKENDLAKFGNILNVNQGLMDSIGVNNPVLADINFRLRQDPNILGSKISGSGLGDCVVGLGKYQLNDMPYQIIPMKISQQGVKVE